MHAVYTALDTTELEADTLTAGDREPRRRLSALEQLNRHKHLVLLGDPGSGKSTFVNYVAMCLCGEDLGRTEANLKTLVGLQEPESEKDLVRRNEGRSALVRWGHGALLPVRVILRDFAARGLPKVGMKATADHLWKHITSELGEDSLTELVEPLKQELLDRGGLILLDGLDEVPEADDRRIQLRQAVESFAGTFGKCRMVVTGRTYAYQQHDWRLSDFETTVLAPFSPEQIGTFIYHWYNYIAVVRDLKDGQVRAQNLYVAIRRNPRLAVFAERPLLLTLMASLHAWRNGPLPENREELYNDAVDLLLDLWERPKRIRGVRQPGLAEFLNTGKDRLRQVLNELAFRAHAAQQGLSGTADIDEGRLVAALLGLSREKDLNPVQLVDYLSHRAGLLLPRGVGVYTFPHRTFQEYLAACYLTDHDYPDQLCDLVRADVERWREVLLLAGAKATRGMGGAVWTLAETLCDGEPEASTAATDVWAAYLAGQALTETARLDQVSKRDQPKLERVRRWLVRGLGDPALPALERTRVGDVLARLGDPRTEVMTVEGMQFCFVPAGDFMMGEDAGLHRVRALDYGYWIGRHPVSQAQWLDFVDGTGHRPKREYGLGGPDNRPVRHVTWDKAQAFCTWMNDHFISALPSRFRFGLPSEAEWEKAARGGLATPVAGGKAIRALSDGLPDAVAMQLEENTYPERDYPWPPTLSAVSPDHERCNIKDTGIGTISTLGCFPAGASPYGCLDLVGNVWEWTRSLYKKYPYAPRDGREDPESRDARMVRGGSYFFDAHVARCPVRARYHPSDGYDYFGFRVVAFPFVSRL